MFFDSFIYYYCFSKNISNFNLPVAKEPVVLSISLVVEVMLPSKCNILRPFIVFSFIDIGIIFTDYILRYIKSFDKLYLLRKSRSVFKTLHHFLRPNSHNIGNTTVPLVPGLHNFQFSGSNIFIFSLNY